MESHTERNDARKPYEPPVVRELGKVTEVTRGIGALGADTLAISAPLP